MAKPTKPDQSKVILNLDEKEIAKVVSQLRQSQRNGPIEFDNSPEALLKAEQDQEAQLKKLFGKNVPVAKDDGDDEGLERNWAQLQKRMGQSPGAQTSDAPVNAPSSAPVISLEDKRKKRAQSLWLGGLTAVAAAALITVVTTFSPENVTNTSLPTFKGNGGVSTVDCSISWEAQGAEGGAAAIAADHQTYELKPHTPYTLSMTCSGEGQIHGAIAVDDKIVHEFRNEIIHANAPLKLNDMIPATWNANTKASLTLFVTAEAIATDTPLTVTPGTLIGPNEKNLTTLWSDRIPLTVTAGQP